MNAINGYFGFLRVIALIALTLFMGAANAKTRIVFLNGITNEKTDAYLSQIRLEEVFREIWASTQLDTKEIVVKHWHNPTGGFVADNIEMLVMGSNTDKADQCAKTGNGAGSEYRALYRACLGLLYKNSFESQSFVGDSEKAKIYSTLRALTEYVEGVLGQNEKIIIVAHSQGNYFAEALHAYISTRPAAAVFDRNVRFVGVASVAPSTPNDKYVTLEQDLALSAWVGTKAAHGLLLPILPRNLDACVGDQGCPPRLQGIDKAVHNFSKIYLSNTSEGLPFPLKKYVSDLVRDAYRELNQAIADITFTPVTATTAAVAGQDTTFTITGSNLPTTGNFDITFNGCTNIQFLTRSSTTHTFSCRPQAAGVITVDVRSMPGGEILRSKAITVVLETTSDLYVKVSNSGALLPNSAVLGDGQYDWSCTMIRSTGAIWEVKRQTGAQASDRSFTYYTSSTELQKFDGQKYSTPTSQEISSIDNVQTYISDANGRSMCGRTNWRVGSPEGLPADWFGNSGNTIRPFSWWTGGIGYSCPYGGCSSPQTAFGHFVTIPFSPCYYGCSTYRSDKLGAWLMSVRP